MEKIFKPENLGDTVYHPAFGAGTIVNWRHISRFPVIVTFESGNLTRAFTEAGLEHEFAVSPTLSFKEWKVCDE